MTLYVDPDELDRAAERYETSAYAAADIGRHLPEAVRAGAATGALTGMLAQVATDLAGLVETLGSSGMVLVGCGAAYRRADDDTAAYLVARLSDMDE
ncbi:hypothetical protein HCA61_12935 [Rhodococcus sp. HNM0563]|uniref:hypothetical protein n=1 Tax=Rhodococcus sp. HNM0563 TaxID=2716339 RepID=UPI00146F87DF|nr:hypothetical protein [Rhodococcus sp. HNM0563]NLU63162.1 hypothetical protein [Rhodococcus sp. HNM0563]